VAVAGKLASLPLKLSHPVAMQAGNGVVWQTGRVQEAQLVSAAPATGNGCKDLAKKSFILSFPSFSFMSKIKELASSNDFLLNASCFPNFPM